MSEQQTLDNTGVDDSRDNSIDVARIIEEKPVGNTANESNDLKQPVADIDTDVEPKKTTSFQITSIDRPIESDCDVKTRPDEGLYTEQHNAENVGAFEQNNSTSKTDTTASSNVQPKKKISFQVTSIESTEGRSRGDSNGYDDMDELNESEFLEEEETNIEATLAHSSGNGNGTSRFKVVKIPRYDSKPYTRGRWRCWDFVKYPPPSAEHLLADLPGCTADLNDRGEHESVSSSRNLLASNASTGAVSKPTDVQFDLPLQEGNTRPNIGNETKIYDEKSAVFVANEFAGNPGSSKLDNSSSESVINNSSGLENSECLTNESAGALTDDATLRLLCEDEVVAEKIKKAMNQVVQIKTDLLQDVNADVKKLKQTIQHLTSENHRLKEENESLKQRLSNQPKTESI